MSQAGQERGGGLVRGRRPATAAVFWHLCPTRWSLWTTPVPRDAMLTGAKAANLAKARAIGLPVLPGYRPHHRRPGGGGAGTRSSRSSPTSWLSSPEHGGPVVVDGRGHRHARRWPASFARYWVCEGARQLRDAISAVLSSAHRSNGAAAPMAVLIQPQVDAAVGGVMFGIDPVTGERAHHRRRGRRWQPRTSSSADR